MDIPRPVAHPVQSKLLCDFCGRHSCAQHVQSGWQATGGAGRLTTWQILLVCKHKQQALFHLPVAQYPVELLLCLVYSFAILAVHDEHQSLGAGVVVAPERTNLVLPTDVPHVEPHILVSYGLNVESDCAEGERGVSATRSHTRRLTAHLLGWS